MATKTRPRPARKVRPTAPAAQIQSSLDSTENESAFADYVVFEKKHDLSDFCDPQSLRYALGGIKYDAEHHEFVASDSRMLAVVPASGKPLESSFLVDAKTLRRANSFAKKDTEVRASVKGGRVSLNCGDTTVETAAIDGRFPKYRDVLKTAFPEEHPAVSISFTGDVIQRLAAHAVRSFGKQVRLTFDFYSPDCAARVTVFSDMAKVATYVVMPLSPSAS